jgi:hypothetical protein
VVQEPGVKLLESTGGTRLRMRYRCSTSLLHSTYRVAVWLPRANSSLPKLDSK